MNERARRYWDVLEVFSKVGTLGFGAAAIWGLIQAEVQERRAWLTKEKFVEGLALVNALPGAPAMQMCIFVGHQRAGWWGGLLAGLAFMAPSFGIVLLLSALASAYGALPLMRDAFYGLGPVVLGVFIVAIYRVGKTAITGASSLLIAIIAAALVWWSVLGVAETLLLASCAGLALHYSRRVGFVAALLVAGFIVVERIAAGSLAGLAAGGGPSEPGLADLALFFFKVGAVTFGGGMTIIAFVQDQVVNHLRWITNEQFIECLTLSQFTPGPIIMVAAYVVYKVAGIAGAAVAGCAIFLPSFVLMLSLLPVIERVRRLAWMKAAIKGITPAVVGAIGVSIVHLAPHAASDALTAALLVLTILALTVWRSPALSLVAAGGLIGVIARSPMLHRLLNLA